MMKWLGLLLMTILAPACKDGFGRMDRTPRGYHVHWKDQGTLATGLHTKAEVYALFDAAMQRVNDQIHPDDPNYLHDKLVDREAFELVDNFYFPVIGRPLDFPNAKYAVGETGPGTVWLAFYNTASGSAPDPGTPAWMQIQDPNDPALWFWGIEIDGQQYPALYYEIYNWVLGHGY